MEIALLIVLSITVIAAGTIRTAFSFRNKAGKPMLWIIIPIALAAVGLLVYIAVKLTAG